MGKKYFKSIDSEFANEIDYWKDYMETNGLKELELFEAERDTGSGYFFCKHHFEVGTVNESCGKQCKQYEPNNGKNGRCKHYGYCYTPTDKKIILKI